MTGESILVAEDDGLIALCLTELMEKAGYRVIGAASSGETVLQMLEESKKPDLILMDVWLAGSLDGIETERLIQQRFSVSLIFLTGYPYENTLERMRELSRRGIS